MAKKRKYISEITEGLHETARDLFRLGIIDEKEMKEFDDLCFESESESKSGSKQVSGTSTRRVSASKAKSKIRAVA